MADRAGRGPAGGCRFDAVLFDAGGVLVLPDPTVLGPLLGFYGGDTTVAAQCRAHYAGMRAKSHAGSDEGEWSDYDVAYVEAVGVPPVDRAEAAAVLGRTRSAWLWRWPIADSVDALRRLADSTVPIGVVSNASGQIEGVLARHVCQVGAGTHAAVRCVVDSELVAVAKPDPAIFDHALAHFEGIERSRIAYVGDSLTMDVASATAAGLQPILLDPYDDHADLHDTWPGAQRIPSVGVLADELTT